MGGRWAWEMWYSIDGFRASRVELIRYLLFHSIIIVHLFNDGEVLSNLTLYCHHLVIIIETQILYTIFDYSATDSMSNSLSHFFL